jgi:hypothetical protein
MSFGAFASRCTALLGVKPYTTLFSDLPIVADFILLT